MKIKTRYRIDEVQGLCNPYQQPPGTLVQTWIEKEPTIAMVCHNRSPIAGWKALLSLSGASAFKIRYSGSGEAEGFEAVLLQDQVALAIDLTPPLTSRAIPVGYVCRVDLSHQTKDPDLWLSVHAFKSGGDLLVKIHGEGKGDVAFLRCPQAIILGRLVLEEVAQALPVVVAN